MFKKAQPVFLKGLSTQMNVTGVFECALPATDVPAELKIAGATRYRAYVDGQLVICGPARAAKGYARVDRIPLELKHGGRLRIYVASYNCHSFDGVCQPGFIVAEVTAGDSVLAATGVDFDAYRDKSRLQKVMRFSYQRHFSEVYRGQDELELCAWERLEPGCRFIEREVPMPCMDDIRVCEIAASGRFEAGTPTKTDIRFIDDVPGTSDGYARTELEAVPYDEYRALKFVPERGARAFEPFELGAGEYVLCDLGRVHTGFISTELEVIEDARLLISYEEYCPEPYVSTDRLYGQYINMLSYELPCGKYSLEGFDPCDLRYMQFNVLSGRVRVNSAGMRQFIYPQVGHAALDSGDAQLDEIYAAAVSTFRQNSLDVFMDCPTRERAGWLCDSYFTAQAEYEFTGDNRLERAFLRNYVQAGKVEGLPEGMLPMCYPSDAMNGEFIPQWAMWYVLELEQALKRSPELDREYFRQLCYGLLNCLDGYVNADGLLEGLPGWNFVEWSRCNDWVQDVSYPTNFLYSRVLKAVGEMYGDEALLARCAQVRAEATRQAFDGELFIDNAVRSADGTLSLTGNTSETGQYYALYFGEVDMNEPRYAHLKAAFCDVFGPDHSRYAALGRDVEPSNAFMGIYLRLELLLRLGMYSATVDEIRGFFGGMAQLTGTLWEHNRPTGGSLNHGFASYAGVALRRALDGLKGTN